MPGVAVDDAHVPGIRVWQYSLRTELGGNRLHPGGHFIQSFLPIDRYEFAGTFRADVPERGGDSFGRVDMLGKVAGLLADKAVSEGMIRVTLDGDDTPVLDLDQQTASVGTIFGANSAFPHSWSSSKESADMQIRLAFPATNDPYAGWRGFGRWFFIYGLIGLSEQLVQFVFNLFSFSDFH